MQTSNQNDDQPTTTQREWHDLKPGDVIYFATGWYEVFDAYLASGSTLLLKLIIRTQGLTFIETHRVRIATGGTVTCRIG